MGRPVLDVAVLDVAAALALTGALAGALVGALAPAPALAQPSDRQVIEDMSGPGVLSVDLVPRPGHKQWNGDYGVWEYVRGLEAIKEYPQKEGITIRIVGDAVYQMYGATDYRYWKFRVLSNEYLGMVAAGGGGRRSCWQSPLVVGRLIGRRGLGTAGPARLTCSGEGEEGGQGRDAGEGGGGAAGGGTGGGAAGRGGRGDAAASVGWWPGGVGE